MSDWLGVMKEGLDQFSWDRKRDYGNFCAQTYYYVRHTPKLLYLAYEKETDAGFKGIFLEHIEEESGHDQWALNDLNSLGFDLSEFPELDETKHMYKQVYMAIKTHGAFSLFGYSYPLELAAAKFCPSLTEVLKSNFGRSSCSFIAGHGVEDQAHAQEAQEIFKLFSDQQNKTLEKLFFETAVNYSAILKRIGVQRAKEARAS